MSFQVSEQALITALNPIPSFLKCRIVAGDYKGKTIARLGMDRALGEFGPAYVLGPVLYGYMNKGEAYPTDKFYKLPKQIEDFITSEFHTDLPKSQTNKLDDILKVLGPGPLAQIKDNIYIGLHDGKDDIQEVVVGLLKSGTKKDLDMFPDQNDQKLNNIWGDHEKKLKKKFKIENQSSKTIFLNYENTATSNIQPLYSLKVRLNSNRSERIKNFLLRMLICTNQHLNAIYYKKKFQSKIDQDFSDFLQQIEANYNEGEV